MFPHLLAGGLTLTSVSSVILQLLSYHVQLGFPPSHPLLLPQLQLSPLSPPLPPTVGPGLVFSAESLPQIAQHGVNSGPPLIPVLVLEQLVELVGPVTHSADVEGEVGANLGGGADRERMPLAAGNTETNK